MLLTPLTQATNDRNTCSSRELRSLYSELALIDEAILWLERYRSAKNRLNAESLLVRLRNHSPTQSPLRSSQRHV